MESSTLRKGPLDIYERWRGGSKAHVRLPRCSPSADPRHVLGDHGAFEANWGRRPSLNLARPVIPSRVGRNKSSSRLLNPLPLGRDTPMTNKVQDVHRLNLTRGFHTDEPHQTRDSSRHQMPPGTIMSGGSGKPWQTSEEWDGGEAPPSQRPNQEFGQPNTASGRSQSADGDVSPKDIRRRRSFSRHGSLRIAAGTRYCSRSRRSSGVAELKARG